MISNITNVLPSLLKNLKNNEDIHANNLKYNLVETIKFYNSILPSDKGMNCLKHMFLDFEFILNEEYKQYVNSLTITLDTLPFLKDFEYETHEETGSIIIRSNYEEFAILSLILMGSIKNLKNDIAIKNKSIFISLAFHFLTFCINNGYNVCKTEDIKLLEEYNEGFDKKMFKYISTYPTSENHIGTIHFVGIEFNKDILLIFEKYKNVKFTYNNETGSYIISMKAEDWDDFWNNAPQYLKDEFSNENEENSYLGNK